MSAPCCTSSFATSRYPPLDASQNDVLPFLLRASTMAPLHKVEQPSSYKCYIYTRRTYLASIKSQNRKWPLSAAIVKAVSFDEGTGGALGSEPLSSKTLPTLTEHKVNSKLKQLRQNKRKAKYFSISTRRRLHQRCETGFCSVLYISTPLHKYRHNFMSALKASQSQSSVPVGFNLKRKR